MKTIIHLLRHGQTTWNVQGLVQGTRDIPLTEEGVRQAEAAGEQLRDRSFSFAYASHLQRARITAEKIAAPHGLEVKVDERLREREYGSMEGLPMLRWGKFFAEDGQAEGSAQPPVDCESEAEVAARMQEALENIAAAHPGETGFLVSHGGTIQGFLRTVFPERFARVRPVRDIKNLGRIELIAEDGRFTLGEIEGVDRLGR